MTHCFVLRECFAAGAPVVSGALQGHPQLMGEAGGSQFAGGTAAAWRSG
ncbi:hypothetical protein D8I24_7622 (plasmid) [Cupriavidus necator H850]|nr:hypothetical protein D8I24_7622 [Cupriavidus necator H850]